MAFTSLQLSLLLSLFFSEIKQQKNKSMFWSVPDMRSVVENSLIFLEQRSYIVGGIDGDGAGPLV